MFIVYHEITLQDSSLHVLDKSALYGSSLELFSAVGMAAAGCHAHRRKQRASRRRRRGVKK